MESTKTNNDFSNLIKNANENFIKEMKRNELYNESFDVLQYLNDRQKKELFSMYCMLLNKFACELNKNIHIEMNIPVYTVTTIEKIEMTEHSLPDFGDIRCVGYYYTEEFAEQAIEINSCDINENLYEYAVIEKFYPGIYSHCNISDEKWYKWDKKKRMYCEIDKPKETNRVCNFAIG